MSWFTLRRSGRRPATPTRLAQRKSPATFRLVLETLEDRTAPAILYVVPPGQPGFHTIQAAVAAAANGDIIQIEPFPGGSNATITDTNIVVMGSPFFTTVITHSTLTSRADHHAALAQLPVIHRHDTI